MTPEHWRRIEELFQGALEREGADRDGYLRASCGEDEALRREVESLLAAHERAGTFIGRSPAGLGSRAAPKEPAVSWRGRRIGPYTVLGEIGRGGMGRVLLAERVDREYRSRVAIKLLDAPFAAPLLVERFRRERQILADLHHPSIARLLDGGTLPEGQPYLVMEHVDGVPLDEHCDRERLTVEERIRIFRQVCEAVQYAHQRLIVHRDLKPANVLVTADGDPKLLDFGIAKLLDPDGEGELTRTRHLAMTPRYASPEQVLGHPVTTGSDVYSLGVLLYELLAGRSPYEAEGATVVELIRQVVEGEPRRPSAAVTEPPAAGEAAARTRGTGLRQLRRRLRGDLDTIVLTALRKEPERRYASAGQLSEDLRRHLEELPVAARPDTLIYRAGKFWRRNPIAASLGAALAASFLVFAAVVTVQGRRAALERDKAERALDFLVEVFQSPDPLTGAPEAGAGAGTETEAGEGTAREMLAAGARRALSELEGDPTLQAPILESIGRTYMGLGRYRDALPLLERAAEIRRRTLGLDDTDAVDGLAALAEARHHLAEYPAAEALFREVLEARRRRLGPAAPATLEAMTGLASALRWQDRLGEAGEILAEALERARVAFAPDAPELADVYEALAMLHRARGDGAAYLRYQRLSTETRRAAYGTDHPRVAEALNDLGVALYEQGRVEEAIPLYHRARGIWRPLLEPDHPYLLANLASLAAAFRDLGRYRQAEPLYRELLAARLEQVGPDHPTTMAALKNYAELEVDLGHWAEAVRHRTRLVEIARRLFGPRHLYVAWSLSELGASLRETGDLDRAEALQEEALAMFRELRGEEHPAIAQPILELARIARYRGRAAEAEARAREALELLRRLLPPDHPDVAGAEREVGIALLARGLHEEAEPLLRSGLWGDDGSPRLHGVRRLRALALLVTLYREWGREEEARRHVRYLAAAEAELRRQGGLRGSRSPSP